MPVIYLGVQRRFTYKATRCIKVTVWCENKCPELAEYKYKCFRHRVTRIEEVYFKKIGRMVLKLPGKNQVRAIMFYEHSIKYKKTTQTDIYVYFYGCDPRPLMICFCGCAYVPRTKEKYCTEWCIEEGVKTGECLCPPGQCKQGTCSKEALMKELTRVVGFLNTVDLFQHPKGTGDSGSQSPCQKGNKGNPAECKNDPTSGSNNATSCKYEVHKFNGKPINVKVTCCSFSNKGQTCYKKLTHLPLGTNYVAPNTNGFRLGNIVYCTNSGSSGPQGTIDYYGGTNNGNGNVSDDHKWKPLLQVTAYFYDEDAQYCDPLLVELVFKKNGETNGDKEYYRLDSRNGDRLTWKKVDNGSKLCLANPECLIRYLDQIRYCLKCTVRIQLECKGTAGGGGAGYDLMGRPGKNGQGKFDQSINGADSNGKIKVCECKCPALTKSGYKCFKHKLGEALKSAHYKVAGLSFTLPCQKGEGKNGDTCCVEAGNGAQKVVEIPVCVVGQGEGDGTCPSGVPGAQASCPAQPDQGTCEAPGATQGLCTAAAPEATCTPGPPAAEIPRILYNRCMGDVYVYFYAPKPGGSSSASASGSETDTVPLMVKFNGRFYAPCSRDWYFTRWVCLPELCKTPGTCKCCCCPGVVAGTPGTSCGAPGDGGDGTECPPDCPCCSQLVEALNTVNESLNRIDLDPEKAKTASTSNCQGYGLPEQCQTQDTGSIRGCKLTETVGNNRVCLTENKPKNGGKGAYVKVVHRTSNGFRIGCLTYCGQDFATNGVNLGLLNNGQTCAPGPSPANGTKIGVANGSPKNGYKTLVTSCGWNTVVVYYSSNDKCMALPQLIVILHTDKVNSTPVTGSSSQQKYGYYILASKNGGVDAGGSGYEYKWRLVDNGAAKPPVQLNDETDFSLLNAAFILLEARVYSCAKYGETNIYSAITKAIQNGSLKESPGYTGRVNRLKNRDITVKDETKEQGTSVGPCPCPCKCLAGTQFRVMSHSLDPLVKLNGQFKSPLCNINLITGLKFVIPTARGCGEYTRVTLVGENGATDANIKYHKPENGNKVYVYFYGCDPRPLLLCYNSWAYAPKDKKCYFTEWVKAGGVEKCQCTDLSPPAQCNLLLELVKVADFLNPVDIKLVPKQPQTCKYYDVHRFNGQRIWIKLESELASGSFCYNKYTHTHFGVGCGGQGFRLGNICHGQSSRLEYYGGTNENNVSENNKWKPLVEVTVYYYDQDTGYKEPLLVILEFKPNGASSTNGDKEYYKLKEPGQATVEWEKETQETGELSRQDKLIQYLHSLRYSFKKVVKLEVWHNSGNGYALMGSDGKSTSGGGGQFAPINGDPEKKIEVKVCEFEPCQHLNGTGYKCFKHSLTSLGAEILHQIGGLKFYTRAVYKNSEAELKLYDGQKSFLSIEKLFYNSCMGDIYVYFYDKDPRPLLLCYNREAYHAKNMTDYDNQKWHKDAAAGKCECPKPPNGHTDGLLKALVQVSNFLNPVKIQIVPGSTKTYTVHWFDTQPIKIKVEGKPATNSFCYNQYNHSHYGTGSGGSGFRLGNIQYKGQCIKEAQNGEKGANGNGKCISASDVNNDDNKHKASPEVVVFYYKGDKTNQHPLLVALRSTKFCISHGPYFELTKKSEPDEAKLYKKVDKGIYLGNTSPEGELAQKLDTILFTTSKKLQIVLATRPVPTEYKAGSDKNGLITDVFDTDTGDESSSKAAAKQLFDVKARILKEVAEEVEKTSITGKPSHTTRDALMHHVALKTEYKAHLSNGPSGPSNGTSLSITVKEVQCDKLYSEAGYRCFKHDLVNTEQIEYNDMYLYKLLHSTGCWKFYYTSTSSVVYDSSIWNDFVSSWYCLMNPPIGTIS